MKQRILTAIVALLILVPLIVIGNWPFILFSYFFAIVALFEFIRMFRLKKGILYGVISVIFLSFLVYPAENLNVFNLIITRFDIIIMFLVVLLTMTVISKNRFTFEQASLLFLATIFIGTSFYLLIEARMMGLHYLLFVLFTIWATDSGAYFAGRSLGKRKLWPDISPNKTIGGALGGIIFAFVVGSIFQLVYPIADTFLIVLGISLIISIVGQVGDLVASAIKRHFKVKDSGNLFPGHGGVLDRLDSLLFVLLVLHIIQFI